MSGPLLILFGWLTCVLLSAWRDVELQNQGWHMEHLRDQLRLRAMEDPDLLREPLFQMLDDDLTWTLQAPEGIVVSLALLRGFKAPHHRQYAANREALLQRAQDDPRMAPLLAIHRKHALHAFACIWLNSPLLTTGVLLAAMAQAAWTAARERRPAKVALRESLVQRVARWMPMTPEPLVRGLKLKQPAAS